MKLVRWAILTGEYPPDPGGVSDYTRLVAAGLARAGDEVRVYAPPRRGDVDPTDPGVVIHRLPGCFGPHSLHVLEASLRQEPRPDRVLLQYVPHSFGFKAINLPFAMWVANRLRRVAPVWVMFHEVAFPLRKWPPAHTVLGVVTRAMARVIAGSADRLFASIPAWGTMLKRICPRSKSVEWLPVPSGVATQADPAAITSIRSRFAPASDFLVGHFGTYGGLITDLLEPTMVDLLRLVPNAAVLLIGRGSDVFRAGFARAHPEAASRVLATGERSSVDVAAYLQACDLVVQPYPDGISTRRTSAMAALANGVTTVTNLGPLSEPLWSGGAVAAVPSPDPIEIARRAGALLIDPIQCAEIGRNGAEVYRQTFALENTVARLRENCA